jgi:predicted nucleic acid-binding protein
VIVVDASVLATALGDDGPDGDHARARLRGERLSAPELVDLEVTSVLRRQVHSGAVDPRRAALALADLAVVPLRRAPHRPLLARCWELRDNLTVYDASYVALAEELDVTLLTGDGRLARAPGLRCHVETLRPATLSGASSFLSCRRQALARSANSGCCVHDVSAEAPCA